MSTNALAYAVSTYIFRNDVTKRTVVFNNSANGSVFQEDVIVTHDDSTVAIYIRNHNRSLMKIKVET